MSKKQRIEVNEDLNVSIGDFLHQRDASEGASLGDPQNVVPCGVPLGKDTKPPKTNDQQKTDIKKMIPKFGKISLQHQRAGRGGRTVTLVSISGEPVQNLEAFLKELKKSLGCGGQIEDGRIVLQGEIADRAAEWFIKMGAKSVINAQKK